MASPEAGVLDSCEELVANPFPAWHPADDRPVVQQSRPDHHICISLHNRLDHVRDQPGVVLVVGMDHDDDIGTIAQGVGVTRLLVSPIPPVRRVDDYLEAILECDARGLIRTSVIDHHRLIDGVGW